MVVTLKISEDNIPNWFLTATMWSGDGLASRLITSALIVSSTLLPSSVAELVTLRKRSFKGLSIRSID